MKNKYEKIMKECIALPKLNDKSEEYYFGENNPLKTRLISNIEYIRNVFKDYKSSHPNMRPGDVLPELRKAVEPIKDTIKEEFNVETCCIGWENAMNAACYIQIANADIWGKGDDAKNLRVKLDDIITTDSKGFHYKKSKGIIYCIVLGYAVFASDEFFTPEEAAAILTHELGHAMQHMITSLNESVAVQQFEIMLNYYEPNLDRLSDEDRKYVIEYMKKFRRAIKSGDKETLKQLGQDVLDNLDPKSGKGFSTYDDKYIEDQQLENNPNWNVDTEKAYKTKLNTSGKFTIGGFIKGIFKGIFSLAFFWVWIPSIISMHKKLNSKTNEEHIYKVFEEAADNFAQIYGLGPALSNGFIKLNKLSDAYSRDVPRIMEKIPMLDLITSWSEMYRDRSACMYGYPTTKNRALNLYKAAKFELANNKELTSDAKKELERQIEHYNKIYTEFVNNDKTKGWFYKLVSGVNRDSIETSAKKDKWVEEQVLIPLQTKADPNFKPDEAYLDK